MTGFATRSDAVRIRDAASTVENGMESHRQTWGLLDSVIIPGDLHTDANYRLGKVAWFDPATATYTQDDKDVLVRSMDANGTPPENGFPVHAVMSGIKDNYAVYLCTHAGEIVRWLRVIESTSSGSGSTWRCYVQEPDGSGGYTDGIECRLALKAGDVFQDNKYYLGTLNGTADDKPKYHAAGETKFILNTCDEQGNPICNLWYMHANFAVVENVDCETGEPL